MVEIRKADIHSPDAERMLTELNAALQEITGSSGAASFSDTDMDRKRSVFLLAYLDGEAAGCGALREISAETAEVKRVYARQSGLGIGQAILRQLEAEAGRLGFSELILETRRVNRKAVGFYLKNGYIPCENYGKYRGKAEAVCFRKGI